MPKHLVEASEKLADGAVFASASAAGISIGTFSVNELVSIAAGCVAIVTGLFATAYHYERRKFVREQRDALRKQQEMLDENIPDGD